MKTSLVLCAVKTSFRVCWFRTYHLLRVLPVSHNSCTTPKRIIWNRFWPRFTSLPFAPKEKGHKWQFPVRQEETSSGRGAWYGGKTVESCLLCQNGVDGSAAVNELAKGRVYLYEPLPIDPQHLLRSFLGSQSQH